MAYDTNGNLIKDLDRDIVTIQYNILNLPSIVQFKNGNQIRNTYDAGGRKLRIDYYTYKLALAMPLTDGQVLEPIYTPTSYDFTGTAYVENVEYNLSKTASGANYIDTYTLNRLQNAEGYIAADGKYYYYRRDHLGNNREVWCATTNSTVQKTQYYPSGTPWAESSGSSVQPNKYNGKEFIEMHGYDTYDYGARGYFAATGRFSSVDPLAENYYSISPYAYCSGNPANRIDPNGMDWYRDEKGNSFWREGDAKTITKNDVVYTNTGTTYTQQIDKNTSITFTQNNATSLTYSG